MAPLYWSQDGTVFCTISLYGKGDWNWMDSNVFSSPVDEKLQDRIVPVCLRDSCNLHKSMSHSLRRAFSFVSCSVHSWRANLSGDQCLYVNPVVCLVLSCPSDTKKPNAVFNKSLATSRPKSGASLFSLCITKTSQEVNNFGVCCFVASLEESFAWILNIPEPRKGHLKKDKNDRISWLSDITSISSFLERPSTARDQESSYSKYIVRL